MEKKCELLAPAGGRRQFYAAVENSADIVNNGIVVDCSYTHDIIFKIEFDIEL